MIFGILHECFLPKALSTLYSTVCEIQWRHLPNGNQSPHHIIDQIQQQINVIIINEVTKAKTDRRINKQINK